MEDIEKRIAEIYDNIEFLNQEIARYNDKISKYLMELQLLQKYRVKNVGNIPVKVNNQYQQDNNPVHRFYTECCIERPNGKVTDNCTTKKMYEVFRAWCKDNNNGYVVSKLDFNKELVKIFNVSDLKDIQKKTCGIWYYNFTLNLATKQDYNTVYGVDRVQ